MGGNNGYRNLITLTAEDHIFAHLLLARWLNTKEMWAAIKFIFGNSVKNRRTPSRREIRLAAFAKEQFAIRNSGPNNINFGKPISQKQRERLRLVNTGKKQSSETIRKRSESLTGNTFAKGFKHSEETRLKVSIASAGRKHTDETKLKMSAAMTGKAKSVEHRRKLSEARMY